MTTTPVFVVFQPNVGTSIVVNADDPATLGQIVIDLLGELTEVTVSIRTANLETP